MSDEPTDLDGEDLRDRAEEDAGPATKPRPKPLSVGIPVRDALAESPMATPVYVDANNLIKRAIMATAVSDLRSGNADGLSKVMPSGAAPGGVPTGGVYVTLTSLSSILAKLAPTGRVYAFFDGGVPARRRELVPHYKAKRKAKRALLTDAEHAVAMGQMHAARELLETLGVTCLAYRDREADDAVAAAVLAHAADRPIVVSSDRDLLQTVAWGGRVWNMDRDDLIDADNFADATGGIAPAYYLLYKTLVGDPSDELDGAKGCGEKRAKELVDRLRTEDPEAAGRTPYEQFTGLVALLEGGGKLHAFEQALLDDQRRILAEMEAVNLYGSFGNPAAMVRRMAVPAPVRKLEFLRRCKALGFRSVMQDPERFLHPFQRAAGAR